MVRQHERRTNIDRENLIEDLRAHGIHRRPCGADCVVDQDIDLLEAIEGHTNQPLAVVYPRQVGLLEHRVPPELSRQRFAVSRRQPGDEDLRALLDEEGGNGRAQALRAAGDDGDFSCEWFGHS